MLSKIKQFIEEYYDYTTTISITESELFSNYEWLEDMENWLFDSETLNDNNKMCDIYVKEIKKDLLYDLLYNQEEIKNQIENDLCNYEEDSEEYQYIKDFYTKWKELFDFKIDELEDIIDYNYEDLMRLIAMFGEMIDNNVSIGGDSIGEKFVNWCENGNCFEDDERKENLVKLMKRFDFHSEDFINWLLGLYNNLEKK